jgi:hypothetical protein
MSGFFRPFAITAFGFLCFALTTTAMAQADLAGVFFGNVSGGVTAFGQFGVMLRTKGTAIFVMDVRFVSIARDGSASSKEVVFVNQNVAVANNGTFSQTNIDGQGTAVSGQFTESGLSGTIVEPSGASARISGVRAPNSGFMVGAGGFYQGPLSGTETINGVPVVNFSGTFSALVAADGGGFAFAVRQGGGEIKKDGFEVDVASDFSITGSVSIVDFEGSLDPVTMTASGTFAGDIDLGGDVFGQSGAWSMKRLEALPNRRPVAANDNYEARGSRHLSISAADGVLANDSDPDGQPLSARLTLAPPVGVLDLRTNGSFVYAPKKGFKGLVTFRYRANDGIANSAEAEVSIDVLPVSLSPIMLLLDD